MFHPRKRIVITLPIRKAHSDEGLCNCSCISRTVVTIKASISTEKLYWVSTLHCVATQVKTIILVSRELGSDYWIHFALVCLIVCEARFSVEQFLVTRRRDHSSCYVNWGRWMSHGMILIRSSPNLMNLWLALNVSQLDWSNNTYFPLFFPKKRSHLSLYSSHFCGSKVVDSSRNCQVYLACRGSRQTLDLTRRLTQWGEFQ